jgi:hypothetical protein
MTTLHKAAQQALDRLRLYYYGSGFAEDADCITALEAALAQQAEPVQEPDLSRCPQCNGPADNGHDRSIPPNPYFCTRCMAEPVHKCPNCASLEAQNTELDLKLAELERAEPVDFVSLLREADEIVRGKPTWKRFIDGTPLSNDIAVWMTVFAQDVARRAAPPQRKPLTKESLLYIYNQLPNWGMDMDSLPQGLEKFARAIERAHGIKERV